MPIFAGLPHRPPQVPLRKIQQPRHRLRRGVRLLKRGCDEAGLPASRCAPLCSVHRNACGHLWLAVCHAAAKHQRRVVPVHLRVGGARGRLRQVGERNHGLLKWPAGVEARRGPSHNPMPAAGSGGKAPRAATHLVPPPLQPQAVQHRRIAVPQASRQLLQLPGQHLRGERGREVVRRRWDARAAASASMWVASRLRTITPRACRHRPKA